MAERRTSGSSGGRRRKASGSSRTSAIQGSRVVRAFFVGEHAQPLVLSQLARPRPARARQRRSAAPPQEGRPGARPAAERSEGARSASRTAARRRAQRRRRGEDVAELREALRQNLIGPLEMVMITRERIEEVLERGGGARPDDRRPVPRASPPASSSAAASRPTTCSRTSSSCSTAAAARSTAAPPTCARRPRRRRRRSQPGVRGPQPCDTRGLAGARAGRPPAPRGGGRAQLSDPRLRRPHRGPGRSRLTDLTPAELRKVRDYERRNANRKTVLNSIESKLG